MKVMVLGANGYLGWPTCMRMAKLGHDVIAIDSYYKEKVMDRENLHPLRKIPKLHTRVHKFEDVTGKLMEFAIFDIREEVVIGYIKEAKPDVIIHFAEQPSAPYSMIDHHTCLETYLNNITGTLNIMWAIRGTDTHLIKLGTMGEYGTPGVHIPEGWIDIQEGGEDLPYYKYNPHIKKAKLPFPKLPGSFYHASKVADSVNLEFGCRAWDLSVTDLNQGIVYGTGTKETRMHDGLFTAFHYDSIFGTALNRFIAQAVTDRPITVYGEGGQTRGWLNIEDTLQCIQIAMENPPAKGEFKVRNQFTEIFSVMELAEMVRNTLGGSIQFVANPRVEQEQHYYSASNQSFLDQGLEPIKLAPKDIDFMAGEVSKYAKQIRQDDLFIRVDWR